MSQFFEERKSILYIRLLLLYNFEQIQIDFYIIFYLHHNCGNVKIRNYIYDNILEFIDNIQNKTVT